MVLGIQHSPQCQVFLGSDHNTYLPTMGVGWLPPQVGRNQQGAGTAEPVPLNGQSYNVFHGKLVINPY